MSRKWSAAVIGCADYMHSPLPRTPAILPLYLCRYDDNELRQVESDSIALGMQAERFGDEITAWVWVNVATWAGTVREFRQHGLEDLFQRLAERYPGENAR